MRAAPLPKPRDGAEAERPAVANFRGEPPTLMLILVLMLEFMLRLLGEAAGCGLLCSGSTSRSCTRSQ